MKYVQAVQYLLEQLPMFQRIGAAAYRSDLGNITELCNLLGHPQKDTKFIHVAGTNGKGSVTHIIASILQQQGYKVGVFVSPHYKDYRERIKINGQYITRPFVTRFVEQNREKFKNINASFFEITTAMAFAYFKERQVDYAVIETGMGGRLDSTNIITPLLSVITNISYDHTQFLGNTLAKIAGEKAGIIKPGIPVVIGETVPETKPVFIKHAQQKKAPLFFAERSKLPPGTTTDLKGSYQTKNLRTSVKAIQVLQQNGVVVSDKAIQQGIKNVSKNTAFKGRWMVMRKQPLIIFDSAHNEAGLRMVKAELKQLKYNRLHLVYGTVSDKDYIKILKLLPKQAFYYFCKANIPRGLNAQELQAAAHSLKLKGDSYGSVKQAYKAAVANAAKNDLVLVAGSIFIVAELL